jgi:hypothetical protein
LTEKKARERVWYYAKKYQCDSELREYVIDWFDGQLEIGSYLGIPYADLYRKDTDLDGLFREAAKRG